MITDEQRLQFIMKDLDSYFRVKKDRWEYAAEVMEEEGHLHLTDSDKLEGFRRLLDEAMRVYNFK